MTQSQEINNTLVLSYLDLRKSVGVIGTLLPFVVAIGKWWLDGPGIMLTVSSYYYSSMGGVFVGSMCAIGVFLFSYRGYDWRDSLASTVGAICAVGVALVPAAPDISPTASQISIGHIHLGLAAGFFLTLAWFSLVLFRKTSPDVPLTRMKLVRNKVYTVCGYAILVAVALIAVIYLLPPDSAINAVSPIFWLEAMACVAFGISWFVKGEAILKDR